MTLFHHKELETPIGVSPPGFDTFILTNYALSLKENSFLDMGTGTGYIAIALATEGKRCVAVDSSEVACEVTHRNALKNNVSFPIIHSDLFNGVEGTFEVVMFNPPYASVSHGKGSAALEWVKSLLPRENKFLAELVFLFVRKSRKKLIERFLHNVPLYLAPKGRVLLLVHRSEVHELLERYPHGREVGSAKWMRLLDIPIEA